MNPTHRKWISRLIRFLIAITILGSGAAISVYWFKNKPSTKRGRPTPRARLVEVKPLARVAEKVVIHAMGEVAPSQKAQIECRVAGKIMWINPNVIPGGILAAGDLIARIDQQDYEIALEQKRAELAKVQADEHLEMGKQAVARKEIEFLDQRPPKADQSLMLRKPQLEKIKASLKDARASVRKAQLDLERTSVYAPFDCIVQSKLLEIGALASVGAPVAAVYGTSQYWIEVLVHQDNLQWIEIPGVNSMQGSRVTISNDPAWDGQGRRAGRILKMKPELDSNSRMACLIVQVDDPMDMDKPVQARLPLLAASYVKVAIQGKEMLDVVKIARNDVRDGNRVFLMTKPQNTLAIRKIEIVWSDAESVYTLDDLLEGKLLVTTDIGAPVEGMALRTADMQTKTHRPGKNGQPTKGDVNKRKDSGQ